jgi:prevent-host-death family protein
MKKRSELPVLQYHGVQTVPTRYLLRHWRDLLEKVNRDQKPIVIFSHNEPKGVLISIDMLNKLEQEEVLQN